MYNYTIYVIVGNSQGLPGDLFMQNLNIQSSSVREPVGVMDCRKCDESLFRSKYLLYPSKAESFIRTCRIPISRELVGRTVDRGRHEITWIIVIAWYNSHGLFI